ncbi:MAG: hypothetical protein DMG34_13850, partial [Acidobacteria bacterium]
MTYRNKLFSLVLAAASASGCSDIKPETAPALPSAVSTTEPAQLKPAATSEALTITAPLIVEHQVDVTAQRDGIVARVSAESGNRVRAGTVLARLDDRQLTANLEAARAKTRSIAADLKNWEAEAEVLKADYVRAQRLWNEKLLAE